MNKILIYHRSKHHSKYSGYDQLLNYLDGNLLNVNNKIPYRLAQFLSYFHSQKLGIYSAKSINTELSLARHLYKFSDEKNVVHYLNGERNIRHLLRFKKAFNKTAFLATFHKPPEILEEQIKNWKYLKKLDGAIAVGKNQLEYLRNKLENDNVVYIPHGIDTNFFKPSDKSVKAQNRLLFVGQHLRDFETLNNTLPIILQHQPDIDVRVVIHKWYRHNILNSSRVEILSGISDEKLLREYQEASILYLPLQNSTACNSILEAMACGLPIVTTDVGGNKEYLEDTGSILIAKNNQENLIGAVLELINDPVRQQEISIASQLKAKEFDWERVAQSMTNFYDNFLLE